MAQVTKTDLRLQEPFKLTFVQLKVLETSAFLGKLETFEWFRDYCNVNHERFRNTLLGDVVEYILGILRNFSGIWKRFWKLFTSRALLGTLLGSLHGGSSTTTTSPNILCCFWKAKTNFWVLIGLLFCKVFQMCLWPLTPQERNINFPMMRQSCVHTKRKHQMSFVLRHESCFIKSKHDKCAFVHECVCVCDWLSVCAATVTVVVSVMTLGRCNWIAVAAETRVQTFHRLLPSALRHTRRPHVCECWGRCWRAGMC